jgi:predicted RNA-binding protein
MCEAAAFVVRDGREELVSEGADLLESAGRVIKITNMFEEKVQLGGKIKSLSLLEHKVILEPI